MALSPPPREREGASKSLAASGNIARMSAPTHVCSVHSRLS